MWVVKIGGSLETAAGLRTLLALLAEHAGSGTVIVPGGGRFADQVRARQREAGMDDANAHHLALRAMEQYAAVLCAMEPRLYPVTGVDEICRAQGATGVPIWLPASQLAGQPGIPASWQVTSDSLSLWFAAQINAEALILIKSAPTRSNNAQELAASGYLDEYFPQMMKQTDLGLISCLGIDEQEVLRQALAAGAQRLPGRVHTIA